MKNLRPLVIMALLATSVAPALAVQPSHAKAPQAKATAPPIPFIPDAVTKHTISLNGKTIAYTARAGTIQLRNKNHQPTARMFYVAYTKDHADAMKRPITFLYNGGPGSSSMWLAMGSWGPVRVRIGNGTLTGPPPYQIVTNKYSLLNKTDLVFIDMPDSGFGRIDGVGKPKDFFGVDQDVAAFGQFVARYLSKFDRWNSPKFLYGESYGTTRSAALVNYLQNKGVGINGVVLQSSILNFGLDFTNASPIGGGDWPYAFYLPTEAATAWYHNALPKRPAKFKPFLAQVVHFAMHTYMTALARGAQISPAQYNTVVAKLHEFTGLPPQYIRNNNLRVPYWRFESELLRGQDMEVGRLDSRFETPSTNQVENSPRWDPTDAAIDYPFTTAVNSYLRHTLKYHSPLRYRTQVYGIIQKSGGWDNTHRHNPTTNVAPDLADAMSYNPSLKIFSANGYFDFATPFLATVYTLNHLGIKPSLLKNITYGFYPSGHMIYIAPRALKLYHAALERWYSTTLAGR